MYHDQHYWQIYKTFTCTCLDYGDIIFNQRSNASFSGQIESFHYNAALVITRAIKRTSKVKHFRTWKAKLQKMDVTNYWLTDHLHISVVIPQPTSNNQTCTALINPLLKTGWVAFQNPFFSECNMRKKMNWYQHL